MGAHWWANALQIGNIPPQGLLVFSEDVQQTTLLCSAEQGLNDHWTLLMAFQISILQLHRQGLEFYFLRLTDFFFDYQRQNFMFSYLVFLHRFHVSFLLLFCTLSQLFNQCILHPLLISLFFQDGVNDAYFFWDIFHLLHVLFT